MTDKPVSPASIATEAADWYARLRARDVSELDAARFRAWLAGDPARRSEFEAIDGFWNALSAIEQSPEVQRVRVSLSRGPKGRKWRRATSWALAASAILAVIGTALFWWQWSAQRYVTQVGEQRTVPLADGSIIVLNTATELRLHYGVDRREVELVHGQASFDVAKDVRRPFIVRAGRGEVRALGTVFDVYRSSDTVTVTLIEGAVAVTPDSGEVVLAPGEQLTFADGSGPAKRLAADVKRVTAWRARKLDFSDTPLAEAIAEANRYSVDQIILDAPDLEGARISGTFEAGKNDLLVEGLQSYFHLDARRTTDHHIVLTAASLR